MSIAAEIKARIEAHGPIPLADYMALCAAHYYATRDPLGRGGDFITAPEVSQMFGELIGAWMATVWQQMGGPKPVRIVELGPGRGTLMADALRAAKVLPAFRDSIALHLVEISPVLRSKQQETLRNAGVPVAWHAALDEVPDGPAIVIANEFFDALPVNQAMKFAEGWHERRVGLDADGRFVFAEADVPLAQFADRLPFAIANSSPGAVFEWRDPASARALGARVARGGAALVIDYGHARCAAGETLQAVGAHAFADPLARPGDVDLTAHVDFEALMNDAAAGGAKAFGPVEQGEFLRRLGIEARAATLKAKATPEQAAAVDAALSRLTGSSQGDMGRLFKVVALVQPPIGVPPGFEELQSGANTSIPSS
jgi:SAM-dependent MidA family methyltransferase